MASWEPCYSPTAFPFACPVFGSLSLNELGPEGAKALAPGIAANGVLTSLDVRVNNLGDEGETAIRKAVEGREGFDLKM